MESNHKPYDIDESVARLDEILSGADTNYEEVNTIPGRDKLTFLNGYYVNCSCVYIDIRKSSSLTDKYKRPALAKLYRAYISETVAILNSSDKCAEINIHGDGVWGVYDSPLKADIDEAFSIAFRLSSVIDILNCRSKKKGYDPISVGIGATYGRALMIKAGYKGSGLNDVVWMGEVVNHASELSHYGNATYNDKEIMVSNVFYNNLNEKNQSLLASNFNRGCYHGNVINISMNDWVTQNCSS